MDLSYGWSSPAPTKSASYLTPAVLNLCRTLGSKKILDLGCGNGALCAALDNAGFNVEGCDQSLDGIEIARASYPRIRFHHAGVSDKPALTGFDTVVSTEVIEHLYMPRLLPSFARDVLAPGGRLILSTPYHGYLKNLFLSIAGKWDDHHTPLWDGGHIKFWSRRTLTALLESEGFKVEDFIGVGRFPYLWKSMVVVARMI